MQQKWPARTMRVSGMCAGGIAGALSWLGIYHFDVVKTRLQSLPASVSPQKGTLHFLLDMVMCTSWHSTVGLDISNRAPSSNHCI